MAWLAVNKDGAEYIYECEPKRTAFYLIWVCDYYDDMLVELPKGSIKKLIGRELTWDNEPVEV